MASFHLFTATELLLTAAAVKTQFDNWYRSVRADLTQSAALPNKFLAPASAKKSRIDACPGWLEKNLAVSSSVKCIAACLQLDAIRFLLRRFDMIQSPIDCAANLIHRSGMLATTNQVVHFSETASPSGVPYAAVAVEGVSKIYSSSRQNAAVAALNNVSLTVPRGAIYGVIGRSGSGKSTLLRLLNGLEKPTSGRVVTDGTEVSGLPEHALRAVRRRIGMIFQNFNLLSSRTVFENVALPLELAGVDRPEIERRVAPLLDLAGLSDKKNRYPAELSGGQKQRVGIARALATKPAVLLSDEATSALDPETTQSILELLKEINRLTGLTIVLVTHEMQAVKSICGRVAVFDSGELIEEGPVYDIFAHPKSGLTKRFVAEVTGGGLPDDVATRLSPSKGAGDQAVVRVIFSGQHATDPLLSRIARQMDLEINILSGQVDRIGGEPFGSLVVAFPAGDVEAFLRNLDSYGLKAEVLGYVR